MKKIKLIIISILASIFLNSCTPPIIDQRGTITTTGNYTNLKYKYNPFTKNGTIEAGK